jgi:hypothetical protein
MKGMTIAAMAITLWLFQLFRDMSILPHISVDVHTFCEQTFSFNILPPMHLIEAVTSAHLDHRPIHCHLDSFSLFCDAIPFDSYAYRDFNALLIVTGLAYPLAIRELKLPLSSIFSVSINVLYTCAMFCNQFALTSVFQYSTIMSFDFLNFETSSVSRSRLSRPCSERISSEQFQVLDNRPMVGPLQHFPYLAQVLKRTLLMLARQATL